MTDTDIPTFLVATDDDIDERLDRIEDAVQTLAASLLTLSAAVASLAADPPPTTEHH